MSEWLRIGVGGVVPIQWEVSKADHGTGELSGVASVYNVVDLQDDIVRPGAFKAFIAKWQRSNMAIPLVLDHQHDTDGIIGSVSKLEETQNALRFTAKFSSVAKAQNARTLAKEGHLNGLSIFGPVIKHSFIQKDGRTIRELSELDLMELSLTGFPAQTGARSTAVKSALTANDKSDEQWISDMQAALAIKSPTARKAAVDDLVRAMYGGTNLATPSGPAEPPKTPEGDGADGSGVDAAKYALDVLGYSGEPGDDPSIPPSADQILASIEAEKSRQGATDLMAELQSMLDQH